MTKERRKLEELLSSIPSEVKTEEVTEGLSVKGVLAHRSEWGRMMIDWYTTTTRGKTPAVPSAKYKWNQLKKLNADIQSRFKDTPLEEIEAEFRRVHNRLFELLESASEEELFTKKNYAFTGTSDLAAYFNSATRSIERSCPQ